MLLQIDHETKLTYSEPVAETVFEVRMAPVSTEDQTVLGYRLRITPPAPVTAYRDGFGNRVDLFNVLSPHQEVVVRATSHVRVHRRPGRERLAEVAWPGEDPVAIEALEFLQPSPLVDRSAALESFLREQPAPEGTHGAVLEKLLAAVGQRLKYEKKVTTARTPLSEALKLGRGVCQDFAHLMLGACRAIGWPARYVSGYVNHPGEIATHAWCQVWGGSAVGWVDVDPTQGKYIGADHVVTAVGRDYFDVPPNRGVWKGKAEETITVAVKVEPVERLPAGGNELGMASSWSAAAASAFQRQVRANSLHFQARPGGSIRHQQSQQQQVRVRGTGSPSPRR
jgi:transglutaminase-like putative cysteine protease